MAAQEDLEEYLRKVALERERAASPAMVGMRAAQARDLAGADRTNELASVLARSAAQFGTLNGKMADASPVAEMASGMKASNQRFRAGLGADDAAAEKTQAAKAELYKTLASRQAKTAATEAAVERSKASQKIAADKEDAAERRHRESMDQRASQHKDTLGQRQAEHSDAQVTKGRELDLKEKEVAAPTKAQAKTDEETRYRYNTLQNNAEKLRTLVRQHGTTEVTGSAGSEMDRLIYEMAIDYAKLVDPDSVAREGEVAAAQKYMLPFRQEFMGIGPRGLGTTNATADQQIKNYMKALDDRLAMKSASRAGIVVQGDRQDMPDSTTAIAAPGGETKTVKGKTYRKVEGGWQEVK